MLSGPCRLRRGSLSGQLKTPTSTRPPKLDIEFGSSDKQDSLGLINHIIFDKLCHSRLVKEGQALTSNLPWVLDIESPPSSATPLSIHHLSSAAHRSYRHGDTPGACRDPAHTKVMLGKMASLLPLLQDILPMLLPASVAVTKAADILPPEPQQPVEGEQPNGETDTPKDTVRVISRNAMLDKTDKMCTSSKHLRPALLLPFPGRISHSPSHLVLILKPSSSSTIRHHGEQGPSLSPLSPSHAPQN